MFWVGHDFQNYCYHSRGKDREARKAPQAANSALIDNLDVEPTMGKSNSSKKPIGNTSLRVSG